MIINNELLDKVTAKAEESPRLRMNYNLHESLDAKAQRLVNVLLPGTILPIHRHRHTAETYILLRGKLVVVFYDETGAQTERHLIDPATGNYGVHIPKNQWHTVEVIEQRPEVTPTPAPTVALQMQETAALSTPEPTMAMLQETAAPSQFPPDYETEDTGEGESLRLRYEATIPLTGETRSFSSHQELERWQKGLEALDGFLA